MPAPAAGIGSAADAAVEAEPKQDAHGLE